MVLQRPWRKLGGIESGFIAAAMAATGFAIWKKREDSVIQANAATASTATPNGRLKSQDQSLLTSAACNIEAYNSKLKDSIAKARDLCQIAKDEMGLPGLVIAVSINGELVWEEGFGYSDLENRVPMKPEAVLRIASISKPMTTAMLAPLIEQGKIDLDCPVQTYLPNFPKKVVDGQEVTITTRQLLSHMSGIRHYSKKGEKINEADGDSGYEEFYKKEKYENLDKSLEIFQNDELLHKPGSKYNYTTHGFTVVSAIIEKLTETPFPKYADKMFHFWGLNNTFLDKPDQLIYHRASYYSRNKHGKIVNAPYVDNSYKWAGGGFLSDVKDITRFANMLLASFQFYGHVSSNDGLPNKPFLKSSTVEQLWTSIPNATSFPDSDFLYGLGFSIAEPKRNCVFCKENPLKIVRHGGGAVGASSILYFAFPKNYRCGSGYDEVDSNPQRVNLLANQASSCEEKIKIKGIVIAMLTNLTRAPLSATAHEISNVFKWMI